MLYLGQVVEEDEEAAVALFRRAAAQNHAAGMFMLGDCMLEGDGCAREPGRAVPLRSEVNIELKFPPQTSRGSFSAVSTPIFASKYALESSRRDLHNALLCTVL